VPDFSVSIEHLDDRRSAMRHLAAMVAKGGHFVLTCPTGKVQATERHFGHATHPTVDEIGRYVSEGELQCSGALDRRRAFGCPAPRVPEHLLIARALLIFAVTYAVCMAPRSRIRRCAS